MNTDDLDVRAKMLALTAVNNILMKRLDQHGKRDLQGNVVEEIRKLADEDMTLVSRTIDHLEDILPED